MDFSDTADEAAFRTDVVAFLEANATRKAGRVIDTEAADAAAHRCSR
jgi:hypothetical protein